MQLELVEELRAVAADEEEQHRRALGRVLARRAGSRAAGCSHAGSSTRCWSSIAQPSVTALSPSRRSSIERSARGVARSARCGRPRGRARASRRGRRSAGSRASRGRAPRSARRTRAATCCGRCSTSRWMFACARRSMPRSASVASSAGSIRSPGNGGVPLRRAEEPRRCPSGRASARPTPTRSRKQPVGRLLVQPLGRVEERRGTASASSSSSKPKRGRGRRRSGAPSSRTASRVDRAPPRGRCGFRCSSVSSCGRARAARAGRGRARSRSPAAASGTGSSRRRPSPPAPPRARATRSACSRVSSPR